MRTFGEWAILIIALMIIAAWLLSFPLIGIYSILWGERRLEGESSFQNAGIAQMQAGNKAKAIEYFEKAVGSRKTGHIRQGRCKSYTMLGAAHYNMGNDEMALYNFKRALIYSPFDANIHKAIAHMMIKRGQYENAETVIKVAIARNPQDKDSMNIFFWLLKRRGAA